MGKQYEPDKALARLTALETQLNAWQSLGMDAAAQLEEIANTRISQTMTDHRAAEVIQENNRALGALAARLRELL